MSNLIACRPASYRKYSDLAFEYLPRAGIYHVEIGPPKPDEIGSVQAELKKHGLKASSLATGCDLGDEGSIEDLIVTMDIARKMEVGVIFCSTKSGDLPTAEAYRKLAELGDVASQNGTVISMETHPDLCQNADQMLATMTGVDHGNVRINFDTANIYYYNEGIKGVDELDRVKEYVASIHLKDTNGRPRTWYFPTLGQGVVDYPAVFGILNEIGFEGPFTMEMEGIEGEDLNLDETHQRILDSMEYLRSIGVI